MTRRAPANRIPFAPLGETDGILDRGTVCRFCSAARTVAPATCPSSATGVRSCLRPRAPRGKLGSLPFSSFTWDETVFKSFQDGYLRNLDFDEYASLGLPIAKRMYRFLSKRFGREECFGRESVVRFDLREFAFGHVGLLGDYEPWKIKQVLGPGIEKLEEKGVIEPAPPQGRYRKKGHGRWEIVFKKGPGGMPVTGANGQAEIEYLVVKNLRPPIKLVKEDVTQYDRIFWIDDKRDSVRDLGDRWASLSTLLFPWWTAPQPCMPRSARWRLCATAIAPAKAR